MPWTVILPDSTSLELAKPYGHECELSVPGRFRADIVLSPANQRIQVLAYEGPDLPALAKALYTLAEANRFGKVWVKARFPDEGALRKGGFATEARIPGFFNGVEAVVMAMYPIEERTVRPDLLNEAEILRRATDGWPRKGDTIRPLPEGYTTALFREKDAEELAALYDEVFPSYPYPITDPEYLVETSRTHVIYRLVRSDTGKLVAAASAETWPEYHNAEMTDFASLPSERGKGLAQYLLTRLEADAAQKFQIECYYTIARAASLGMLRTFHQCGYVYSGTLTNNCHISGRFETMHVMYRA